MKYIFIPFFVLLTMVAYSQKKRTVFKRSTAISRFEGNWKGTMLWTPNNGTAEQKVAVTLTILPVKDSAKQYTWNISYGASSADVRPYILKKIDTVPNHWVIDEQNGIVLDHYLLQGKLMGAFNIGGVTLVDNYWIENNELHFEFITIPTSPTGTTGKDTDEVPKVGTYKVRSYQKGVLKKWK